MSIAQNVRYFRKQAGLTQLDFADKIGVSIATLRRWESGETAPNGTRLQEMADFLKVSPEELVSEKSIPDTRGRNMLGYSYGTNSNGMLVYEGGGTRIELPPTEKGYEIFNRLVENITKSNLATSNFTQTQHV